MELKQYMRVIRKRLLLISSIVVIVSALVGVKGFMFTQDVYQSTAKLIVSQSFKVNGTEIMDWSNVQTNLLLISSYKEIIYSSAILNKVVTEFPELNETPANIASKLVISSANDSQVMNISAVDTTYKHAAEIVNAVSKVFKEEIPKIMKVDNVTILSEADSNAIASPINSSPIVSVLLAFIVSLMLAVGLVFLLDYLDDTIKSEEDVNSVLDLPMLSYISRISRSELKTRKSRGVQQKAGEGAYAAAKQ
ncbi:capsular polysaccharide biosynthesis protein [Paenibacillus cellulosilyticus]|uniref:Capsular polysaccharide biosynthesis protein n=1 Tax=Paenibacillus cellulosilyticus TaxID=375489 RepID=A0A2V2YKT1_9BACL|nr:Wzz/FepE/Etk N-terminal domain-containing protein [Paenibacillus cellulosilyticus]PWV93821.1 capsular polysaccharide biosynthesis protein [Paenibacillus cellulosilyticus]QKS47436.1 lipopolysaccharide biosynthesis protein [Paenibacillus cellulosilyticus]